MVLCLNKYFMISCLLNTILLIIIIILYKNIFLVSSIRGNMFNMCDYFSRKDIISQHSLLTPCLLIAEIK